MATGTEWLKTIVRKQYFFCTPMKPTKSRPLAVLNKNNPKRSEVISSVKREVDELALKLIKVEIMLAKRNENTISGGNESPKKENGCQG